MDTNKLKALVSLLDDDDWEVAMLVEKEIRDLGGGVIPFLENQWESNEANPKLQQRIEDLIHEMQLSAAVERLSAWKDETPDDLLRGMWAVASYQYPSLMLEEVQSEMQNLLTDVWNTVRDDMHPNDQIRLLNQLFFDKYKFLPNTQNYHALSNSMINQVLGEKKGNPISLCVIYMLMAQHVKLPIYGVNLPNIFILTYKTDSFQFYINVFNRGVVFNRNEIDHYIKQMHLEQRDSFYEPCSTIEIIKRVLRNLLLSYDKSGNTRNSDDVRKMLALFEN